MIDDELELEGTADDDLFFQDGPGLFEDEELPAPADRVDAAPSEGGATTPAASADPTHSASPDDAPATLGPPPARDRGPRQELPDAPLALYRRYRPDTFADVIGQGHVTDPIGRALTNNRVNHAYLFSGPRGCGKTTSARILARALNCDRGPTPEPCGECTSCRDLARGGSGSIDVIEIDAASHGGVDDARDLRERAFFAPVHSRYKIYIIDEAHMVTTVAFNALLKLVEEPPPHVKFIFATTEPDKVIGTIRSRTHHYPFRLVPPKVLTGYLASLCEAEKVDVDPAVLPLVVRAGAGSVRDSLSVLDQLLGAADQGKVGYEQAATLLGYTPDRLLDEVMDAFAAGDGRGVFGAIDKVIEVGQDPRRFGEDLLRRLRDLVIVAAVPDALSSGLIDVAADQAERLENQARTMGAGELTRAAEVIAAGLTEMRGTTAPRLHLELMCSRVLLPGADVDGRGLHARVDRLERRLADTGVAVAPAVTAAPMPVEETGEPIRRRPRSGEAAPVAPSPSPATTSPAPERPEASSPHAAEPARTTPPADESDRPPVKSAAAAPLDVAPEGEAEAAPPASAPGTIDLGRVRTAWDQVLDEVRARRKYTYALLSQNASVMAVLGNTLTLGFTSAGTRDSFGTSGSHDVLRDSLVEVLGADLTIEAVVGGEPAPSPTRRTEQRRPAQAPSSPAPSSPAPSSPANSAPAAAASTRRTAAAEGVPGEVSTVSPGADSRGAPPDSVAEVANDRLAPPHLVEPPDESTPPDGPAADQPFGRESSAQQPSGQAEPAAPVEQAAAVRRRPAGSYGDPGSAASPAASDDPSEPEELAEADDIIVDDGSSSASDLIKQQLGAELLHEEER